jgi:PAS domain S-box-containing protein
MREGSSLLRPVRIYLLSLAGVLAAVLGRWLLDPVLGDAFPLVTLFGAVAFAVWLGGYRPGLLVAVLGYLACSYLFIAPRNDLAWGENRNIIGAVAYGVTCSLIIGFGEAMRAARKRAGSAEASAREKAELLAVTFASIGDAVITTDSHGRVATMNPIAESLTGWKAGAAIGMPLPSVFRSVDEQTGEPVADPVARALRESAIANHTLLVAKDGTKRPIDERAGPIRDERGHEAGVILVFRDITEKGAAEEALRRSERFHSDFFDNATIPLHWVGPDGTIIRVNQQELDMLGYSREEYLGHPIADFHVDRAVIEDMLVRLARGETLREFPTQMLCKDGTIRDVRVNSNGYFEDGTFVHSRCITTDVTELKRARELQPLLAAIVEASDDAIISKSLDGIILSWNAGAERLFEYTAEEAVGKSIELVIPADLRHEEQSILERLRRGERIVHYETVRTTKSGRLIDISLTSSPVRDETGHIFGASKTARDITERKRAEREREHLLESERTARTRAEKADRLKDEFLGTVSHELRTPLNGILGWAQVLQRTLPPSPSTGEALTAIERSARMQAQIIDDLLDMNRIVSGKLRLDVQTTDLTSVIEAAMETVRPSADAKDIQIQTVLDPKAGPIKGDPARLQQVVWNLLSNAVKFTPRGGTVQVFLERTNSQVVISVTDTGKGMSEEFLPHAFERFRQADSSTTRQQGGLGLGLAIVKQIVELHGGSVSVSSEGEGKGSTFRVQMPVSVVHRPEQLEPPREEEAATYGPKLTGTRILVVDDDPGACDILSRLLQACEATIVTAQSGKEALEKIAESPPDLLLCDIGMPEMDGFDLIRIVRETHPRLPAIAITAFARAEDRIRVLHAGFHMHIAKPVDARELLVMVQSLLRSVVRDAR